MPVKDRPALSMILDGERTGKLDKRRTILDSTSGNTGIAYAMVFLPKSGADAAGGPSGGALPGTSATAGSIRAGSASVAPGSADPR